MEGYATLPIVCAAVDPQRFLVFGKNRQVASLHKLPQILRCSTGTESQTGCCLPPLPTGSETVTHRPHLLSLRSCGFRVGKPHWTPLENKGFPTRLGLFGALQLIKHLPWGRGGVGKDKLPKLELLIILGFSWFLQYQRKMGPLALSH